MPAVYRQDLPRRIVVWTCNACPAATCEFTSDAGAVPFACPLQMEAQWRRSR
jgi:hypothetical protein